MNVKQLIPKEQRELIINALEAYQHSLSIAIARHEENGLGDVLHHDVFDITGLIGMMKYDVEIALPKKDRDGFCFKHGVDFPDYGETITAKYPVVKDEWVTVITGTISFTDDGVHGRSASIQNIISMEKHLSSRVDEVVICLEENGHDYIVVEEYDGRIDIDIITPKVKDERVFQVVDVCGSHTTTEDYISATDGGRSDYTTLIDNMGVGELSEIHKEEVYIIRIK